MVQCKVTRTLNSLIGRPISQKHQTEKFQQKASKSLIVKKLCEKKGLPAILINCNQVFLVFEIICWNLAAARGNKFSHYHERYLYKNEGLDSRGDATLQLYNCLDGSNRNLMKAASARLPLFVLRYKLTF